MVKTNKRLFEIQSQSQNNVLGKPEGIVHMTPFKDPAMFVNLKQEARQMYELLVNNILPKYKLATDDSF
jgi:hypothetical protein